MKTAQTSQDLLLSIFEKGVAQSTEKLTALSGTQWAIHIISIDVGTGERFRSIIARDQRDYLGVSCSSPGERYRLNKNPSMVRSSTNCNVIWPR